jgi:acetyl esterase/lipase
MPPAFLVAGTQDQPAISQGLASLYLSLRDAGIPAELHLYDRVGHGFGLRSSTTGPIAEWPLRLVDWLGERFSTMPLTSDRRPAQTIGRCPPAQ